MIEKNYVTEYSWKQNILLTFLKEKSSILLRNIMWKDPLISGGSVMTT